MKKKIQDLIDINKTSYLMEAHNAISAKIVEKNQFDGIWLSGLTISASCGLRDFSEISYSDVLHIVDSISNITEIPIILDMDSGYGDFNNARLVSKRAHKLGVSAVCIEDKMFPKTNSFINSRSQELCDIKIFEGKIKAIKDTVNDKDFFVIARTEALINQSGLEEALKRAERYYLAGADAIFIHSKKDSIIEIKEFMSYWNHKCPVVIAPTTYADKNVNIYRELGISMVIWANYMLRASVYNMNRIAKQIYENKYPDLCSSEIVDLNEIFKLQNVSEYLAAKEKYLEKL